jgi:hypothetical protein
MEYVHVHNGLERLGIHNEIENPVAVKNMEEIMHSTDENQVCGQL